MIYRIGFKFNHRSLWIGVHYSKYNRRACINLLPCMTIWIVFKNKTYFHPEELLYGRIKDIPVEATGRDYNELQSNIRQKIKKMWFTHRINVHYPFKRKTLVNKERYD